MITRSIGPFGGLVSAVNAAFIPDHCAQDLLNVMVEDGKLNLRRSYRQVAAWDNTITACFGLGYLLGYSGTTEAEEFVTVVTKSGNTRPYAVHPTTGAYTEIKNGVASVSLSTTDWLMVPFGSTSYWVNTNDTNPVWKHTIADATSMSPVLSSTTTPTVDLTYTLQHSNSGASGDAYDKQSWAGLTPATAITNNSANVVPGSSLLETDNLKVAITSASATSIPFNFDVTHLASKDYSQNDLFIFRVQLETVGVTGSGGNELSPYDALKFSFYNGSAYVGASVQWDRAFENNQWVYYAYVSLASVARASRTAITRVKVEGSLLCKNAWLPLTYFTIVPYWVGMVDCSDPSNGPKEQYAYSYINTTTGDETGLYGTSNPNIPYVEITDADLKGFSPYTRKPNWKLGVWVKYTVTASSDASIDKDRLYVSDRGVWRRFDEIADGGVSPTTATAYYRYTAIEKHALPARSESQPGPFPNMVWAFPHKGWMVWCLKGGRQNILHSGVGVPERLPSAADLLDDDTRPGKYSLGDNYAEQPVCGFSAGDAVIVLSANGVFAQVGDLPSAMTPFKRVPGSKGVLNKFAACRWRDENGNPGVAFATRDGVYFVIVDQQFDGDNGYRIIELSADIRNRVGMGTLVPLKDVVRLVPDENGDTLWAFTGTNKVYPLRRPSLVDGVRRWEYYEYRLWADDTSFKYMIAPVKYGIRVMSNVGHFLELEFDSANSVYMNTAAYQFYEGSEPPALPGFPEFYWQSKDFEEANRRVIYVQVTPTADISPNGGSPQITVMGLERSGGTATKYFVTAGDDQRTLRFGPLVQGRSLSYKLTVTTTNISTVPAYEWDHLFIAESEPLSPRRTR